MFKPISLFIGLRYTRARKSNHFLSFFAVVSTIGLMLGVAVLITVLSVMNGFDRELKNRILGMVPQVTISSNQIITDWQQQIPQLEKYSHVVAAAPFTQLQGMITAQGQVAGMVINGIDPKYEPKVSVIQNFMAQGSLNDLKQGEFGIVLGKKMADAMGLQQGDKVTVVLPEATPTPAGVVPRFKRFTIVGIFDTGAEVDGMMAYVDLNDAAALLRLPNGAQSIRLKLDDIFAAPEVVQDVLKDRPASYYGSDWTYTHGSLFSAIQMEKAMIGLLLFMIVLVAVFNIVSSLVMTVADKKADIAILRTLGASPSTIVKIFMVQGTVIGAIGTLSGAVLGVILGSSISAILGWVNNAFGLNLFAAYFINYLPSQVEVSDVLTIVVASLLLSFVATIYPAMRAAKIQPAEALRYE
ncbi:lipoprotein-releasing ABC transporter permease subunit [Acinetobacter qingfengensis]|uniref:Cell division protein FtsX n=1 Tax=Acinetobacter qingfengensis TaxID=1262585 RepID=A0A1E7RF82_9GAMM|nr:lipoprotein-releasing ABC transporter permease subunit [Acinetobacter qingfengensis]KAA8731816.1 lipoprotein-releasing ABC transporter permease subunit [Acinetobacter qingfengensis]OEY98060.1 cell division protein FtsX [Acinetobacter qingfengensis]